jgi:hypothetical protein
LLLPLFFWFGCRRLSRRSRDADAAARHALRRSPSYVQVKTQFAAQPQVYNQFLEIMKNFKAQRYVCHRRGHGASRIARRSRACAPVWLSCRVNCASVCGVRTAGWRAWRRLRRPTWPARTTLTPRPSRRCCSIDTPGVIQRVSELFRGHNNLILGFNTFLPPGFRIEVVNDGPPASMPSMPGMPHLSPPPTRPPVRTAPAVNGDVPVGVAGGVGTGVGTGVGAGVGAGVVGAAAGATSPDAAANHGPLEFGQAINYVTKIKRRFVDQPHVYKQFLEILHMYQKQERNIKDVLDRVRARSLRVSCCAALCCVVLCRCVVLCCVVLCCVVLYCVVLCCVVL